MTQTKSIAAIVCVTALAMAGCRPSLGTVERTTDQARLAEFAVTEKDYRVAQAAARKITDPALLGKVALEAKDWGARYEAVRKLTEEPVTPGEHANAVAFAARVVAWAAALLAAPASSA